MGVILLLPSAVLVSICLLMGARWGVGGAGRGVCSLCNTRKRTCTLIPNMIHRIKSYITPNNY